MASIRSLKKEIDWLWSMAITECFYILETDNKADKNKIGDIISEVIVNHQEFRDRVNHPDGKDNPKIVKAYYKQVRKQLYESAGIIMTRLSETTEK